MHLLNTIFALCVAWFCLLPFDSNAAVGKECETVREIGSRLELFVDDWLIEKMSNTILKLYQPIRKEIVFRFDAPWEGALSGYVTIMKDDNFFRMYYRGGGDLSREYTCLAESNDGISWKRPSLGLFEFNGSKDNNIIWTGSKKAYCESHNFSPFKDTNPHAIPDHRYKAVTLSRQTIDGQTRNVLMAFVSSDGIRWQRLQDEPIITEGAFDSHNTAFWDTIQQNYVCYSRVSRNGKRSIQRSVSPDFVRWSKPQLLDFGHTPIEHLYTNGIVPYPRAPHLYLGLAMRFVPERREIGMRRRETDGLSDAVLFSSHDGLHWNRAFMEAFVRPGPNQANWGGAHGNNTPAWGIVQTNENELSIYLTENYGNYPEQTGRIPVLRRATIRTDGFASVNAPYSGAEMLTKPLIFSGSALVINYSTSAVGGIKVEIQDQNGEPIPKFTLADAIEIYGDEIERNVCWQAGADVSQIAGRIIRLRFFMRDADLYSIRFRP